MNKLVQMARPQFSAAGLGLFILETTWAILLGAPFHLARMIFGYMILFPALLSISYSNDYYDVEVDLHGKPTFFSGGSGMLVEHPELRRPARRVALILSLCSVALGILFQITYAMPAWFWAVVLVGNLVGWAYSAPPFRLATRGLGELAMIFCIGVLIPGLAYTVASGNIDRDGWLFTIPLMFYGLAFILSVEIPDMEMDRLGKKNNWVARKGRGFGFNAIGAALLLATLFFLVFPWLSTRTYPVDLHFLGMLSLLPLGAGWIGLLKRPVEKDRATRAAAWTVIAMAVFCMLADGYLILLAARLVR